MAILDKSVADFRDLQARVRELIGGVGGAFDAPGYLYGGTVYYTSSGTFTKGDYPGLRAVLVEVQGGGGSGAGVAGTSGGNVAESSGGSGGGYSRKFILASALATSETVTVGSGGARPTAGGNPGNDGGDSWFGQSSVSNHLFGGGGLGGLVGSPTTTNSAVNGVNGGTATGGDINIDGGGSYVGQVIAGVAVRHNRGGDSHLGIGGRASNANSTDGIAGTGYGSGGSGGRSTNNSTNRQAGAGADGIVIVHLYY